MARVPRGRERRTGGEGAAEPSQRRGRERPTLCPLLGIPSGPGGRALVGAALAAALDKGDAASLALVDVDEFDAMNRLLGDERGDDVLLAVARRVASARPAGSTLVRLGGDVLALALPGLELEQALVAMQTVATAVSSKPVAAGRGAGRRQAYPTASVGVASAASASAVGFGETLARAQAAVRRAKELGRGRVAAPPADRMVLKTSYYGQTQLARLRALAQRLGVPDSTLLREALEDVLLAHKERRSGPRDATSARPADRRGPPRSRGAAAVTSDAPEAEREA